VLIVDADMALVTYNNKLKFGAPFVEHATYEE